MDSQLILSIVPLQFMDDRLALIGDENAKALLRMLLNPIPGDRPTAEELLESKEYLQFLQHAA